MPKTLCGPDIVARATVVGVYPVEAAEPCHLIELTIEGARPPIDVGLVTQRLRGRRRTDWQVPWDEHFLDLAGRAVLETTRPRQPPTTRDSRVVFFFHYLDVRRPLESPWGKLTLPQVSDRPPRLAFLTYESPCWNGRSRRRGSGRPSAATERQDVRRTHE